MNLVTGGSGFIGRRLIRALEGDIKVVSRNKQKNYETVIVDFESEGLSSSDLINIDTIFHLSGVSHDVRDANKIRELYYQVNVRATKQLALLAAKSGVKNFVFISSTKAGGRSYDDTCANEENHNSPEGIYGATKRKAEEELLKIGKDSGMHVSIVRPSLVYGPDVKGNLKSMLYAVKKGWFPPLPETGNRRSMIHVDDLVRAILLVAKDKRANGEVFIVTDGTPYSSREIYNTMCNIAGKPTPRWSVPKVFFDIASLLSPRIKYKVNKLLGSECYSSAKLEKLGFKSKKTLKDMNETEF